MKNLLGSILISTLLIGCSTPVPVTVKFPEAPSTLLEPAESLTLLPEDKPTLLSDILENTTENAAKYYALREKYRGWQEWYRSQRKIFEEVQKK